MTVTRLLGEMDLDEFAQWKALYTVERNDQNAQQQPVGPSNVVSIAEFVGRVDKRKIRG